MSTLARLHLTNSVSSLPRPPKPEPSPEPALFIAVSVISSDRHVAFMSEHQKISSLNNLYNQFSPTYPGHRDTLTFPSTSTSLRYRDVLEASLQPGLFLSVFQLQSENWISIWCWMVFGFSKLSPGAQRPVFRLLYGLGFKGLQWSCCRDRTFSVNEYWRTSHSYQDSHSVLYNLELVPLIFSGETSVTFPKSVV